MSGGHDDHPPNLHALAVERSPTGLGLIVVGVERQGLRFSLSHIAENKWRAYFMGSPMFAPAGFGVAPTPWQATQRSAWAAVSQTAAGGSA